MTARFTYSLHKVGPTRAAEITGVSNTTQRDWRRMKHLPATEGIAQYDLIDLCELWVLKAAAEAGFGPARTKPFSRSAAAHMAWHALRLERVYEGDHHEAPLSPHNAMMVLNNVDEPTPAWGRRSRWLADHIIMPNETHHADGECNDLYGIFPDGQAFPMDDVSDASVVFDQVIGREPSAVIVLPLKLAAAHLVDKAREPLVQVSFQENPPPPPFHEYDALGRACLIGLTFEETMDHERFRQIDWLRHNRCDSGVEMTREETARYRELLDKHAAAYRAHLPTKPRGRS